MTDPTKLFQTPEDFRDEVTDENRRDYTDDLLPLEASLAVMQQAIVLAGDGGIPRDELAKLVDELRGMYIDEAMLRLWRDGRIVIGWGENGMTFVPADRAAIGSLPWKPAVDR